MNEQTATNSTPDEQLPDLRNLKEEQRIVFDVAILPRDVEFILVQGVAGSGKTSIALNIIKKIADDTIIDIDTDRLIPGHQRQTVLFITYNQQLVDYCKDSLKAYLQKPSLLWRGNDIKSGYINIITYRQLCNLLIDNLNNFLEDAECIKIIEDIRFKKQYKVLLAPQIFALITTFLKGRTELKDKNLDQLKTFLNEKSLDERASPIYTIYKSLLLDIKENIQGKYHNILKNMNKEDRADLNIKLYKEIQKFELWLQELKECSVSDLNNPVNTQYKLCDRSKTLLKPLFDWLRIFFKALPSDNEIDGLIKMVNSTRTNKKELDKLKQAVPDLIYKYGAFGTSFYEKVGSYLQNPVIIVDELQDLSSIECNILLSLWFQLKKTAQRSKLIFFGDLNQQITPTGFRWEEDVIETIKRMSKLYDYDEKRFNSNWSITEDDNDRTTPFRSLKNNYRTTWHIAALSYNLVHQMVPNAIHDERTQRYYTDNIIDPTKTEPVNLISDIIDIIEGESPNLLEPKLMIGTDSNFMQGLEEFCNETFAEFNLDDSNEEEMRSLVVITQHPEKVARFKDKQSIKQILTYYPILGCKGLEFTSCVIWGLPIKESDQSIELDLIGQWYTSLTRAKLKILIYLTEEEFETLQRLGWRDFKDIRRSEKKTESLPWHWWKYWYPYKEERNVFENVSNTSLAERLKDIGLVKLSSEALKRFGDITFNRFKENKKEETLKEALYYYKKGGWNNETCNARKEAAKFFEKENSFELASNYFNLVEDNIGVVRCYIRESHRIKNIDVTKSKNFRKDAEARIGPLILKKQFSDASECYCWLKEWNKSFEYAKKVDEDFIKTIGTQIFDVVKYLVENNKFRYKNIILDVGTDSDAYAITEILQNFELYEEAGKCWRILNEFIKSVECFIKSENFDLAEETAIDNKNELKKDCLLLIADAYYKKGERFWNRAFYFYYLANEPQSPPRQRKDFPKRCLELDAKCQRKKRYIIVTRCWIEVIKLLKEYAYAAIEQVIAIANARQNLKDYETAIECWNECRKSLNEIDLWRRESDKIAVLKLSSCWMEIYNRTINSRRLLLGPEDRDYHESRKHWIRFWVEEVQTRMKGQKYKEIINAIIQKLYNNELDDELKNQIENTVSTLIVEPIWKADFLQWLYNLKKFFTHFEINGGSEGRIIEIEQKIPSGNFKLDYLREITDELVLLLIEQASKIAHEIARQRGREEEAVYIWYEICRLREYRERAENFINERWNSGEGSTAVTCWRSLGQFSKAQQRIFSLDIFKEQQYIIKLLEKLYEDQPIEKNEAIKELEYMSKEGKSYQPYPTPPKLKLQELLEFLLKQSKQIDKEGTLEKLIKIIVDARDIGTIKVLWNDSIKKRLYKVTNQEIKEIAFKIDEYLNK